MKSLKDMKWLGLFLILFATTESYAQIRCADVRKVDGPEQSVDPLEPWNHGWRLIFRDLLIGNPAQGERELDFYWHTGNPFNLKKIDEATYGAFYSYKTRRIYRNKSGVNPPEPGENPIESVNTMFGRARYQNLEMVREFLKLAGNSLPKEVINEIREVEEIISNEADLRESFGMVRTGPMAPGYDTDSLAVMRVFNGVKSHSNTPFQLPLERSLKDPTVGIETKKFLLKLREQNPEALIFEIGKWGVFNLRSQIQNLSTSPAQRVQLKRTRERSQKLLELFLLRYYVDGLPPEAVFLAHVDTTSRADHFKEQYNFKVLEEIKLPGVEEPQFTLKATGADLRVAFDRLFPSVPRIGVRVIRPQE